MLMNSSFSFFRSLVLVVSWLDVSGQVLAAVVIDTVVVVILGVVLAVVTAGAFVVVTHSGLCDSPMILKYYCKMCSCVQCLF